MNNSNIKLNRFLKIYLFSMTISLVILDLLIAKTLIQNMQSINTVIKYVILLEAILVFILLILFLLIIYLYLSKKSSFKKFALVVFRLFSIFLLLDTALYVFIFNNISNTMILFIIYIYIPLIVLTYNMDVIVRHLFK